jgi:P-type Ca2+ transporter type 2C
MSKKWHALSVEKTLKELDTSREGLSKDEAEKRLKEYGPNELKMRAGPSLWVIFGRQFLNPLVYIILAAAIVKFSVGHLLDGYVLALTVAIMTLVGFFQEARAEQAMEALKDLTSPKSRVRRNGEVFSVPSDEIVPGDVVLFESGDKVTADMRLIKIKNLQVDESSLTGESAAVAKTLDEQEEDASLADRKNMVYMGTAVTSGKGEAVVAGIGMDSQIGKIAQAMHDIERVQTPLQKSIHSIGVWMLVIVSLVVILFVGISFYAGLDWLDVFMLSVSAAVAAIPEGLPAAVTVVLAAGMTKMAKRHAIIRKMMAVETLGSTTVICSDKTGTLTQNRMTVRKVYIYNTKFEVGGEGLDVEGDFTSGDEKIDPKKDPALKKALEIGAICSDASLSSAKKGGVEVVGDATEGALLIAAAKGGFHVGQLRKGLEREDEIPFKSDNQYMATLHKDDEGSLVFIKGSPEKILSFSSSVLQGEETIELTDSIKKEVEEASAGFAKEGLRLIAVAYCRKDVPLEEDSFKGSLVFVGMFAMFDPPRQEVVHSIESCKDAGIRVIMVTGDNKNTAEAIAEKIGIHTRGAMDGRELAETSDEELKEKLKDVKVFARIEPLHKLRIVRALQDLGHVVAMTGDGVNDAPALEAADIGVAMGQMGTDVAKEASEMVLTDDNFSSIVAAVEEGRAIFNRLRNVSAFLLTTCFGELFGLIICVLLLGKAPLIPLQILWINLVTGVIVAVPLGLEPKTGSELKQDPRDPKVQLIFPGMVYRIAFLASVLGFSVYLIFIWGLAQADLDRARTLVFTAVVAFEWLIAFTLRSDEFTVFKLGIFKNKTLLYAVGVAVLMQMFVLYWPVLQIPFRTDAITLVEWGVVLLPGILLFILDTVGKLIAPKLFSGGKWKKSN